MAALLLIEERACESAVLSVLDNGTGPSLDPATTCFGALCPFAERTDIAMDWAWAIAAALALLELAASDAAVRACSDDATASQAFPDTTCL
jgi:hypothetical protein